MKKLNIPAMQDGEKEKGAIHGELGLCVDPEIVCVCVCACFGCTCVWCVVRILSRIFFFLGSDARLYGMLDSRINVPCFLFFSTFSKVEFVKACG